MPRTTRYEEPARRLPTWEPPSLAQATRYSGASIRHTTGRPLTLDQAHDKIRAALARAVETPRAQWSWGILHESDLIGLISLRRRTPVMGTISYILREDSWGNGYATHAAWCPATVRNAGFRACRGRRPYPRRRACLRVRRPRRPAIAEGVRAAAAMWPGPAPLSGVAGIAVVGHPATGWRNAVAARSRSSTVGL
ncbi:GNAT family N-acetyltransferase [Streptomyces lavendulocolor]|uniref:GNAT family N-acetyltransferase n=1 Tax=Streptomyces lavendulocolor TaxID=67316 RepID=UPI003C2F825A